MTHLLDVPASPWVEWPDALADPGWVHTPDFFSAQAIAAWRQWGHARQTAFRAAGTGKGHGHRSQSVRGDRIHWLDWAASPLEQALGQRLDALRRHLNETLFLNLIDYEGHLAIYPPGQGYAPHVDRFRVDDARTVSLVIYLNAPDWTQAEGGALRLHLDSPIDCLPLGGHAVAFRSADVRHEVLPATRERWSIAVWFRQPRAHQSRSMG